MNALVLLLFVPGQVETVPSKEFSKEMQTAGITATVRIINAARHSTGSGAVVGKSGPFIYILTAGHVVAEADRVEVRTWSAESYPKPANVYRSAEVVARSDKDDLALVRFATSDPVPGSLKIVPLRAVQGSQGFPGLAVGCDSAGVPTCVPVQITGKKRVRKRGEEGAVLFWELDSALTQGRSGGPLLDKQGSLIGVASIASAGRSYCCPPEAIHALLRQHGLSHLAEPGAD